MDKLLFVNTTKDVKRSIESGEQIDYVMLTERANVLNFSFQDDVNIGHYIQSLSLRKTNPSSITGLAKDLKMLAIRRKIHQCGKQISQRAQSASPDEPFNKFNIKLLTSGKSYEYFHIGQLVCGNNNHAMEKSPRHKCPSGAMPQSTQQHGT